MTSSISYQESCELYSWMQQLKEEIIDEVIVSAEKKAGTLPARVEVLESLALMNSGLNKFRQVVLDHYSETKLAADAKMLIPHMKPDICSMSLKKKLENILVGHPFCENM